MRVPYSEVAPKCQLRTLSIKHIAAIPVNVHKTVFENGMVWIAVRRGVIRLSKATQSKGTATQFFALGRTNNIAGTAKNIISAAFVVNL